MAAVKKPEVRNAVEPIHQAPARPYLGAAAQPEKTKISQPAHPHTGVIIQEGGETCASATVIGSLPFNATGYTCDNVDDYEEMNGGSCPYSSNSPDVVYSYAPSTNQTINIALCASLYDTKLFVYQDACASGTAIACNDDACGSDGYKSAIYGLSVSAGHTYYIVVDGYGGSCGDYAIAVTSGACDVVCPSGGIPEGEPTCYDEYVDNYNGGCNSPPNYPFQSISCNTTICGTSGTYLYTGLQYRDTDWFRLVITQPTTLTYKCVAEFPLLIFLIDALNDDCVSYTILTSATAIPCDTATIVWSLQPKTYYLWVGPSVFTGVTCGSEYVAIVNCEVATTGACCNDIDYTCTIETPGACAAMPNHTFQGLGTTCTPNPCAPGSNCSNPIVVDLNKKAPGDTLYFDQNQTTCGKGHDYDYITCLNPYDGGEDIIYQINVTSTVTVDINLDDKGNTWGGVAIDDECPPASPCMAYATGYSGPYQIKGITLTPGTYFIMVDTWPAPDCIPDFDLTIIEAVPCDVVCPPGAVLEGEPVCYDGYVDIYNGGCNSSPYVFQDITCPTTICGTSGVYDANGYRDTDWFRLVLTEGKVLTWSAVAEFPVLIFIVDAGSENCSDYTILGSTTAAKCDTAKLTMCVPAGVYWLLVMPSDWGSYPCGVEYVAKAECEAAITGACCNPNSPYDCQITTESACDAMSYTFKGICTSCGPPNPCLPAPTNDDCEDAIDLGTLPVCPTVLTEYGTTIGATNDCPGVFDWPGVWYKFVLPFASNNLYVDFCPTNDPTVGTRSIALLNSCDNCAGWIAASSYTWVTCPSTYTDLQENWKNLPAGTYWLPVLAWDYNGYNMNFGFSICVEEAVPCVLQCPPNGIPEGEPACYDGYVDNYNGGCNSSPYIWQNINCGDTICGTSGVYSANGMRDTDWFRVQAGAGDLTWTVVAEFPVLIFIMDAGSENCSDYTQLGVNYTYNVCDTISLSVPVPGGVYWLWVGPVDWGNYPCGDLSEYVAWVDCVPFGPQIAWTPTSFDQLLNPTGACSTATESLFISSVGGEDLNWSIAENPPVSWLAESPLSGTLPPGTTATLNVSFNAGGMAPGDYNTNLEITSNAPKGVVTVPVHLKVELPPDIDVATRLWEPVIPGCPNERDLSVDNLGTGDLRFEVMVAGSPPPLDNGGILNKVPNRKAEDLFKSNARLSDKSNLPKLTTSAPSDVSKAANVPNGPTRAPKNVQNVIWDNGGTIPGGNALSSQLDQVYPFVSQMADDFILTEGMNVTDVHWWGLFWNGTGFDPTDFYIYIYADDGTGNAPTGGGMPDPSPTALATYFFPAVTGLPADPNGFNEYNVTLNPPFPANANVKYWIAIQAVFAFPPQWGWAQSSIIQLHDAMQGFPLLGYEFWTMDNYVDVAFYLTGEPGCPMTVSPPSGTIPPSGHTDLTLTFDGTKFDVCGVDTTVCYLVFTSNDCDESQVVVPVYMWAARGDVNEDPKGDCVIDIRDVVFLLNYVFKGGPAPDPMCIGDVDRDNDVDSDDALYLVSYLFLYGPPPEIPLAPKGNENLRIKTNSPIR
jgi:hypothetical protein